MDDDRFDGLYLNVAQQARGIEPLLDTVFSFLRRKTDFFDGPNGDSSQALKKVEEVFSKHAQLYQQSKSGSSSSKKTAKPKPSPKPSSSPKAPPAKPVAPAKEEQEPVIEMGSDGGFDVSSATKESETPKATIPEAQSPPASSTKANSSNNTPTEETKEPAQTPSDDVEGDKAPDSKAPPPLGNGGTEPGKYVWTQTLQEVTVTIPVPDGTRGRDLTVVIGKKHLKVGVKGQSEMIVDAPLTKIVVMDDSFWTVEDGNRCVIQLQKLNDHEWWNSVCQGHSTIDVTTIQPESSSLADLDGETRKTVEKMMYDQRQKAMGLPSSDEESKMAALERFKAQHPEMDFSNAKINY